MDGWMSPRRADGRVPRIHFSSSDEFPSVGGACVTEISRPSPSVIVRRGGGGGGGRCFVLQPQEKEGRREMKMTKEKNPPTGSFGEPGSREVLEARLYIYFFGGETH